MDCRGATGVLATNSLHSSRLSAFLKVSLSCSPVHSFMLSSHLFFCLPLFLPPGTVPCSMVFDSPDDLVTCPYHFNYPFRNPTKLGQERLRLHIQKHYQFNVYIAGKRLSIREHPVDWREIFMKLSVGKCKQINFWNLCV